MDEIKIPKWVRVVEVLLIFIVLIVITSIKFIKEYKSSLGSSDSDISTDYKTMTEFYISNGPNFIIVIDKSDKVSNIIFLNKASICLYNKNIEKNTIEKALPKIIEAINSDTNNYFNGINRITLFDYGDELVYNKVKEELNRNLVVYGIKTNISEDKTSLKEKTNSLGINKETDKELLSGLSFYSKNLVSISKNNVNRGDY